MKSITTKQIACSLAGLGMVMLGSSAFAATSWSQGLTSYTLSTTPAMTITAWSTATGTAASPTSGSAFATATIANYGSAGLGVATGNENSNLDGPHAIDNGYGVDALQIDFTSATNLSALTLGWNASDSPKTTNNDGTCTRLTGCTNKTGGAAVNYNDSDLSVWYLATTGWTLVGNFADVGTLTNNTQSLGATIYSSSWLISAYSSAYGSGTGLSDGNDAFKVLSISGNTCTGTVTNNACGPTTTTNVPEPGSLALIGAAMAGFVATRGRKSKAV